MNGPKIYFLADSECSPSRNGTRSCADAAFSTLTLARFVSAAFFFFLLISVERKQNIYVKTRFNCCSCGIQQWRPPISKQGCPCAERRRTSRIQSQVLVTIVSITANHSCSRASQSSGSDKPQTWNGVRSIRKSRRRSATCRCSGVYEQRQASSRNSNRWCSKARPCGDHCVERRRRRRR